MQLLNTLVTVHFIATSITVLCCLVVIDQSLLVHAVPSTNVRAAPPMVSFVTPAPSVSNNVAFKWRSRPTGLGRRQSSVVTPRAEKENKKSKSAAAATAATTTSTIASTTSWSNATRDQLDQDQEATFEDQLQDDQEALHRIALILGLVGGIGGIAIVASIVIYTKMRLRNKQGSDRESRQASISGYSASYLSHGDNDDPSDGGSVSVLPEQPQVEPNPEQLLPSAPPAPLPTPSDLLVLPHQQQQHHHHHHHHHHHQYTQPSSSSSCSIDFPQDAPGPSAPSAKEIGATNTERCIMPFMYQLQLDEPLDPSCPECHNADPLSPALLEVPPPAYTPSAPPLDALLQPGSLSSMSRTSSSSHIGHTDDTHLLSPSQSSIRASPPLS